MKKALLSLRVALLLTLVLAWGTVQGSKPSRHRTLHRP